MFHCFFNLTEATIINKRLALIVKVFSLAILFSLLDKLAIL